MDTDLDTRLSGRHVDGADSTSVTGHHLSQAGIARRRAPLDPAPRDGDPGAGPSRAAYREGCRRWTPSPLPR